MPTAGFQIISRRWKARHLAPRVMRCSARFRAAWAYNDLQAAKQASKLAWNALNDLALRLRNEQDQQRLAAAFMAVDVGILASRLTPRERAEMIRNRGVDRHHANCAPLSLRDACNKIAHHDTAHSAFRIDGRGAHYIVLSGPDQNPTRGPWVAEMLVSRFCSQASKAVAAFQG
jgi:hypothetical protein